MNTPQNKEAMIDLMTLSLAKYLNGKTHAVAHEGSPTLVDSTNHSRYPNCPMIGPHGQFETRGEAAGWAQLALQAGYAL